MKNTNEQPSQMRLYNQCGKRLYVNATERMRFATAAAKSYPVMGSFGLTLLHTGCRISEALALHRSSIQNDRNIITFRTLKRRREDVFREIPVPPALVAALDAAHHLKHRGPDKPLWVHLGQPLNRVTAYRWIKLLMAEADIFGAQACPKGLRHGFGIHAQQTGVPLNMIQKWMGHADMSTTAIYTDASGKEEMEIAGRMWCQS